MDIYAVFYDAAGNEIYRHAVRTATAGNMDLEIVEEGANVTTWETKPLFAGRTYDMKLEVQLSTGERPVIWTGKVTT